MRAKPFFDTNVLIYAVVNGDPRAEVARALLTESGTLSIQVLNEFTSVARRKLKMSWSEVAESLKDFRVLCEEPIAVTVELHEASLEIAERYGYTIYDSLLIAAALKADCLTLYSEDMRNGQKIQKLVS